MRGATQCAKTLKKLLTTLRGEAGKVTLPATGDPITQLILGVLTRNVPESQARQALDQIRGGVVDYNELRVIPAFELTEMLGDFPDARTKADDILRALNRIFAQRHDVALDHVAEMPKKERQAYLEDVDGLDAYSRARVLLLGLELPAFPLDEAMWAYARHHEIVDAKCPLDEAEAFLERQIKDDEALECYALIKQAAWADFGNQVAAGAVERIESIPAERKTSHMLADLAPHPVESLEDVEDFVAAEPATDDAKSKRRTTARKTAKAPAATETKQAPAKKSAKKATKKSAKAAKSSGDGATAKKTTKAAKGRKKSAKSS